MRPPDITDEELREWTRQLREFEEGFQTPRIEPLDLEVWVAGMYLGRELRKLKCGEDLLQRICYACGQRQSMSEEPWGPVYVALENYRKGFWEEPGEKLAIHIIKEKFGEKPNPQDILNFFINTRKVSLEDLAKAAFSPKPKCPYD